MSAFTKLLLFGFLLVCKLTSVIEMAFFVVEEVGKVLKNHSFLFFLLSEISYPV